MKIVRILVRRLARLGRDPAMIEGMANHWGWGLEILVLAAFLLPHHVPMHAIWVPIWLLVWFLYWLGCEMFRKSRTDLYNGSASRLVRTQVNICLTSALIVATSGSESYFWPVYLLPILASIIYYENLIICFLYLLEVLFAYLVPVLIFQRAQSQVLDLAALLVNGSILATLTVVLFFLFMPLFREARRKAEILSKMMVDSDAALGEGLADMLTIILKLGVEIAGAKSGSLMMRESADTLRVKVRVGAGRTSNAAEMRTFRVGEGIAGWVAKYKSDYYCQDAISDERFRESLDSKIGSLFSVPLLRDDVVIGVLTVDSPDVSAFEEEERELLKKYAEQAVLVIKNVERYETIKKRERELETLGAINEFISSTLDLDVVLKRILDEGLKLTQAQVGSVSLLDKETQELVIRVYQPPPGGFVAKELKRMQLTKALTGWVAKESRPALVPDTAKDPRYLAFFPGMKSELAVPILLGLERELVGVLNVESPTLNRFGDDEQRLLEGLASQAAIAIQNAQNHSKQIQKTQMLESLIDISKGITWDIDLDDLLESIAKRTSSAVGADSSRIFLCDENGTKFSSPTGSTPNNLFDKKWLPKGKGLAVRALKSRTPIPVENATTEPLAGEFVREKKIQSFVCCPLLVGDKPVGVLYVDLKRPHKFTNEEMRTIELFANQAAIAVENSEQFLALRRKTAELEAIMAIEGAILESDRVFLGLDSILQLILDKALELMPSSLGYIMWHDQAQGDLQMRAQSGVPKEHVGARQPIGKGLVGLAAERKETVLATDLTEEPWASTYLPFIPNMQSGIAVPIMENDEVICVLNAEHPRAAAFDEESRKWLEKLARQTLIAIQNVTRYEALQKANAQLRAEQDMRVAAQRAATLSHLAANFAHRIINEIGTVPVGVQEIRKRLPKDLVNYNTVVSWLDRIEEDAKRLMEMAAQLRKPFEVGQIDRVDVNLLLTTALSQVSIADSIRAFPELAKEPLYARVNSARLIDVFKCIIENAVEAMPTGGTLMLSTSTYTEGDRTWVEVAFHDSGAGIPDEIKKNIFEPFFTTKQKGRLGIGLWWCRTFVGEIGGNIEVESKPGNGSLFRVKIPKAREP